MPTSTDFSSMFQSVTTKNHNFVPLCIDWIIIGEKISMCLISAAMMSWVGCLLTDSVLPDTGIS